MAARHRRGHDHNEEESNTRKCARVSGTVAQLPAFNDYLRGSVPTGLPHLRLLQLCRYRAAQMTPTGLLHPAHRGREPPAHRAREPRATYRRQQRDPRWLQFFDTDPLGDTADAKAVYKY